MLSYRDITAKVKVVAITLQSLFFGLYIRVMGIICFNIPGAYPTNYVPERNKMPKTVGRYNWLEHEIAVVMVIVVIFIWGNTEYTQREGIILQIFGTIRIIIARFIVILYESCSMIIQHLHISVLDRMRSVSCILRININSKNILILLLLMCHDP